MVPWFAHLYVCETILLTNVFFSCDSINQFHEVGRITVSQLTTRNNHRLLKLQYIHACFKKTMILYLTMLSSYFFLSKNNLKQIIKLVYTHVLFLSTKFLISWAKQSNHINLNNDLLFGLNHLATWLSLTRNPTLSAVKGPNNGTIHQLFETTRCSNNHCFVFNVPLWSAFSHGTFRQLLSQSRCPDREIQLWQPGSFVVWHQHLLCDRLCHAIQPFFGWLRGWSHLCGYSIRMTRNGIRLRRTRWGVLPCPCIEPVAL